MALSLGERVYARAPAWAQTALLNAYAYRLHRVREGRDYDRIVREWNESQWWEPQRLRAFQDARLREIVAFAYARVPFYRQRFDAHGVRPADIEGVHDLPRLPILTKDEIRAAGDTILVDGSRKGLLHGHTSGTTGSPLSLWYDRDMASANTAADWRQKHWAGVGARDWCGLFLGRVVVPVARRRPPFWRANYVNRHLWFSSFHLNEANLDLYVAEIRRRGLRFLEGYPSTMYILARHILRRGETLPLAAVFSSSETLHGVQREALGAAFACPIFDFYGHAERVIFAGECERHEGKHLFDEYGAVELVDDGGQPVAAGQPGWLTGTTLWNRGMPLLRYRTGDLSRHLAGPCACGRGLARVADVATKAEDIVVTPDGRYISPSVLTHPFKPFDQLRKSQIVQEAPDSLLVRLAAGPAFTPDHQEQLVARLQERLGAGMRIRVELVEDIPPEPSGKFRWVISRVPHGCAVPWEG